MGCGLRDAGGHCHKRSPVASRHPLRSTGDVARPLCAGPPLIRPLSGPYPASMARPQAVRDEAARD